MEKLSSFIRSTEDIPNPTIPQSATCRYRLLQLTNQMRILLISDPDTKKSAASLDVHVGSTSDPHHLQGLAHYMEHMLLAATAKYPEENGFSLFLNRHGGRENGLTEYENTSYYFDVAADHLMEALDRFAQMFLSPLFPHVGMVRRVHEVHSEYIWDRADERKRILYVKKETMNPTHPFCKFTPGNKYSLARVTSLEMQRELMNFHKQYYSSNLMCMVVRGKESLDELVEMVVPIFAALENEGTPVPVWPDVPLIENTTPVQISIVPLANMCELQVCWRLEDMFQYCKSKPCQYLAHLLSQKGPGSLLAQLKERDLAACLHVTTSSFEVDRYPFIHINICLTCNGLHQTVTVTTLVFQYLNMLYEEVPREEFHTELEQLKAVHALGMDSHIRSLNYVVHLSRVLQKLSSVPAFEPKEILNVPLGEYNPALIERLLRQMNPRNVRTTLVSKDLKWTKHEKWFGTCYSVQPISEQTLQQWEQAGTNQYFHLPSPNSVFIPRDFNLYVSRDTAQASPTILQSCHRATVWYKTNAASPEPKLCFTVSFSLERDDDDVSVAYAGLLKRLVEEAISGLLHLGQSAGISSKFFHIGSGFVLNIQGYYDKQDQFLQQIMKKMINVSFKSRFNRLKAKCVCDIQSGVEEYIDCTYLRARPAEWSKEKLIPIVQDISPDHMGAFMQKFLSDLKLKILVFGNISKERAQYMADIVENEFRAFTRVSHPIPYPNDSRLHSINSPPSMDLPNRAQLPQRIVPDIPSLCVQLATPFLHPAMPPIPFPHPGTFPSPFPHPANLPNIFPRPVMHQRLIPHPTNAQNPLSNMLPYPVSPSNPFFQPVMAPDQLALPPGNNVPSRGSLPSYQDPNMTSTLQLTYPKDLNEPHSKPPASGNPFDDSDCHAFDVVYVCSTSRSCSSDVLVLLLHQMLKEACVTTLRGLLQLGYLVRCSVVYRDGQVPFVSSNAYKFGYDIRGLRIHIYPITDANLADVERLVDACLDQFGVEMENMSDAEFKDHVNSVALDITNSENWEEQNYMYWSQCLGRRVFDQNVMLRNLMSLTKRDVCAFYQECLPENAPRRCKEGFRS